MISEHQNPTEKQKKFNVLNMFECKIATGETGFFFEQFIIQNKKTFRFIKMFIECDFGLQFIYISKTAKKKKKK